MPLYEYRCVDCGALEEHVVPLDERGDLYTGCETCYLPKQPCSQSPMVRVLTAPHLHGSANMPNA